MKIGPLFPRFTSSRISQADTGPKITDVTFDRGTSDVKREIVAAFTFLFVLFVSICACPDGDSQTERRLKTPERGDGAEVAPRVFIERFAASREVVPLQEESFASRPNYCRSRPPFQFPTRRASATGDTGLSKDQRSFRFEQFYEESPPRTENKSARLPAQRREPDTQKKSIFYRFFLVYTSGL